MSSQSYKKQEQELKSAIMDEIEDAVDDYMETFRLKSDNGNKLPSINEIEDIVTELKSKTRDIYLRMVSESISGYDESNLIESKKANTKEKG